MGVAGADLGQQIRAKGALGREEWSHLGEGGRTIECARLISDQTPHL